MLTLACYYVRKGSSGISFSTFGHRDPTYNRGFLVSDGVNGTFPQFLCLLVCFQKLGSELVCNLHPAHSQRDVVYYNT